jgi:hypothetical protein
MASDVKVTLGFLGLQPLKDLKKNQVQTCIRWLMPMPVFPAMQAGSQPPLGYRHHPASHHRLQ